MTDPVFRCNECGKWQVNVDEFNNMLAAAHDDARTAETRGWNAAIDAAIATMKLMGSANIGILRKPAP